MKIKYKLPALLLIMSLLPFLIISTVSISHYQKALKESIGENISNQTQLQADMVAFVIKERINEAKKLASMPEVKRTVLKNNLAYLNISETNIREKIHRTDEEWIESNGATEISSRILNNNLSLFLKNYKKIDPDKYGEIFVTDVKGATVGMTKILSDYYQADEEWWEKSFNNGRGREFIDSRGYDESAQSLVLGIVVPVKEEEKVTGILKINYLIAEIIDIVSMSRIQGTIETFLVNFQGKIIIYYGKYRRENANELEKKFIGHVRSGWIEDNHYGLKTIMTFASINSQIFSRVLTPYSRKGISGEKWEPAKLTIFTEIDQNEAFTPVRRLRNIVFAIGSFAAILISLLAMAIARLIIVPITKLTKGAEIIGEGNLHHKINIGSEDEIGELAGTFNAMTEKLKTITLSRDELINQINMASVMEDSNDAIILQNLEGNITSWNRGAEKMYGWKKDEALAMNICEILPSGSREGVFLFINKVVNGTQKESFETHRKNRKDKVLDVWVTITKLVDEKGNIRGIATTERDITELKHAETKLRDSEEKFVGIASSTQEAIIMIDSKGAVTFWNRAAESIFGYKEKEILGKDLHKILASKQHYPEWQKNREEFAKTGQGGAIGKTVELEAVRKDETKFPIELSLSSTTIKGKWHGIGVIRDVSERNSLQEQLLQSQKMESIGRLAGGIAHDFNNFLAIVLGYGEMVLDDIAKEDPNRKRIEMIVSAGKKSAHLAKQLLLFSRSDIAVPVIVGVESLINGMTEMLQRLIGEDYRLLVKIKAQKLNIKIDPKQMEQVILNMVINARDAMPEGGTIIIETKVVDLEKEQIDFAGESVSDIKQYVKISVADTGQGIEEKNRLKIFEPFFTTKGKGKGTGLGLSTSFGIINKAKGHIRVQSKLGQGTSFEMYLPLKKETPIESKKETSPSDLKRGTETVLLVEDNEDLKEQVAEILKEQGYIVLDALNGKQALKCMENESGGEIDLLLTDVIMPGIGGRELAKRVTEMDPAVKILFMSGYTDDVVLKKGIETEKTNFLSKPFTQGEILNKMREILDN